MQKFVRKNIRVVIEPEISPVHNLLGKSPQEIERVTLAEASRLVVDIKRHVDDAHPEVKWDGVYVCEFCGDDSDWEGEPMECCNDAVNENGAAAATPEGGEDE